MEASYEYYNPFTIHDSSNSICHNAIVAAKMGRPDLAYENWLKSVDIDFGVRARASDGIHFANVGGMWQEIVLGFAGMINALGADVLTLNPCIPEEIDSISFKVVWKGQEVEVTVTKNSVSIRNLSDKDLEYSAFGKNGVASPKSESVTSS